VLAKAGSKAGTRHIAFEGFEKSLGSAQIQLIRCIPLEKAMSSTLLAYEKELCILGPQI
jgi:DMSO/TMAO reductase YedYZ molybdopterin-dependent catalytic subunit